MKAYNMKNLDLTKGARAEISAKLYQMVRGKQPSRLEDILRNLVRLTP
jgi:hypothetical protein